MQHLWSLAIEEQFYLVWPLVVFGCLAARRTASATTARRCAVVGAVASTLVMAALYDGDDPSRAYYGTDARVHTILIGALLAICCSLVRRRRPTGAGARCTAPGSSARSGWSGRSHALSDTSPGYYHGGSVALRVRGRGADRAR